MFEHTSRYYGIEDAIYRSEDGRETVYKLRRFLPQYGQKRVVGEVIVKDGERLDLIVYRCLGDPDQFWRICDANDAMNPFELVSRAGRILVINDPHS